MQNDHAFILLTRLLELFVIRNGNLSLDDLRLHNVDSDLHKLLLRFTKENEIFIYTHLDKENVEASPAVAMPDAAVIIGKLNHVLKINANVMTTTGVVYIEQVIAMLSTPTPPSAEQSWCTHIASINRPTDDDVYLVDYAMPGLNGRKNTAQAIIHFHPKHGWRSKITPAFAGDTPKDSAYAVKHMIGFKKIFGVEQPDSAANGDLVQKIFDTSDRKAVDTFKHCPRCNHKCDSSQRITEQDAREILKSYFVMQLGDASEFDEKFDYWLNFCDRGRTLLAKLNEHREPDYKAQVEELQNAIEFKDIEIDVLAAQRDDLLEALLIARELSSMQGSEWQKAAGKIDAAIAKASASDAEGGK